MIEEIVPQLPLQKEKINASFNYCKEHRKFIDVDKNEFSAHLEKAKSDLNRIRSDYENQAWDWVMVKSYYSVMHAFNALLVKEKGFFSKDHFCTILALKFWELMPKELYLKLREIHVQFADFTGFDITYSLRKIGQYDVYKWKKLSAKDAEAVYSMAKEIVSFVEERCYL